MEIFRYSSFFCVRFVFLASKIPKNFMAIFKVQTIVPMWHITENSIRRFSPWDSIYWKRDTYGMDIDGPCPLQTLPFQRAFSTTLLKPFVILCPFFTFKIIIFDIRLFAYCKRGMTYSFISWIRMYMRCDLMEVSSRMKIKILHKTENIKGNRILFQIENFP